jgi:hypothetical protein
MGKSASNAGARDALLRDTAIALPTKVGSVRRVGAALGTAAPIRRAAMEVGVAARSRGALNQAVERGLCGQCLCSFLQ